MNQRGAPFGIFSSTARTPPSRRRLAWFALGVGGWAFAALVWLVGFQGGPFVFPGGDTRTFYAFAGDAFRSGADPYAINADGTAFFYAPPWRPPSPCCRGQAPPRSTS